MKGQRTRKRREAEQEEEESQRAIIQTEEEEARYLIKGLSGSEPPTTGRGAVAGGRGGCSLYRSEVSGLVEPELWRMMGMRIRMKPAGGPGAAVAVAKLIGGGGN